jgi:hypothetical protein
MESSIRYNFTAVVHNVKQYTNSEFNTHFKFHERRFDLTIIFLRRRYVAPCGTDRNVTDRD